MVTEGLISNNREELEQISITRDKILKAKSVQIARAQWHEPKRFKANGWRHGGLICRDFTKIIKFWKFGNLENNVTPLFEKGQRQKAGNYHFLLASCQSQ